MGETKDGTPGSLLARAWRFMARDKVWWISPILLLFVLLSMFLILVEGSTIAPLMYSMF